MSVSPTVVAPLGSLLIHTVFLALLLLLSIAGRWQTPPPPAFARSVSPTRLLAPPLLLRIQSDSTGTKGGGAGRMTLPDSQGQLPPSAAQQPIVLPSQVRVNEHPLLEVPPTLDIPSQPAFASLKLAQWGNPLAQAGPPSDGRGRRGRGIGDGNDDGIGPGSGGPYGGLTGRAHTIGRGVSAPVLIHKIEPDYSEEARKAKYQGSVTLRIIVDEAGAVRHVEVTHPLGLGLDEKAVEAVRRWRFRPGQRDGKPVPVWAAVEVFFRLL